MVKGPRKRKPRKKIPMNMKPGGRIRLDSDGTPGPFQVSFEWVDGRGQVLVDAPNSVTVWRERK